MHFNDLIARFRVQALGGTATIGAAAALVTSKTEAKPWTFVALLAFLFVAWTALWLLDYGYYQKLLGGSVRALTKLEKELPARYAKMSTDIEANFGGAYHGHYWFYSLIQIAIGLLFSAALYDVAEVGDRWHWWGIVGSVLWMTVAMLSARPSEASRKKATAAKAARKAMAANGSAPT
jgi:hypothetical protein